VAYLQRAAPRVPPVHAHLAPRRRLIPRIPHHSPTSNPYGAAAAARSGGSWNGGGGWGFWRAQPRGEVGFSVGEGSVLGMGTVLFQCGARRQRWMLTR
jgi:hypothetical protein